LEQGGTPTPEWEKLLGRALWLAHKTGFYRFSLPRQFGGQDHKDMNLWICAIRYHLSSHPEYGGGLSLANDLQNEHSVVRNFPNIPMLYHFGTPAQRSKFIPAKLNDSFHMALGLTEMHHGSDATYMDTVAKTLTLPDGQQGYEINGNKKWQ
jgi:alkylation response protein AidB-like acyl-CoA dehydrogenase